MVIDCKVGAGTVSVVLPSTPLSDAVILAAPLLIPTTKPDCTVATAVFDEVQVTEYVTSPVVLSEYVAVATSCRVPPIRTTGEVGVISIDVMVAAFTVNVVPTALVTDPKEAVIMLAPAETPVASPPLAIVATPVFAECHVTLEVMSALALSE